MPRKPVISAEFSLGDHLPGKLDKGILDVIIADLRNDLRLLRRLRHLSCVIGIGAIGFSQ